MSEARVVAKNSEVIRNHAVEIFDIFTASKETALGLTLRLYQSEIMDRRTKSALFSFAHPHQTANALMEYLEMKLDQSSKYLPIILKSMKEEEVMKDLVEKIELELSQMPVTSNEGSLNQELSYNDQPLSNDDNQPLDNNPGNAIAVATKLKSKFESLLAMLIMALSVVSETVNLNRLKLRISWHLSLTRENPPPIQDLLLKLQKEANTPEEVLDFLVNHNLVGYINYKLIRLFNHDLSEDIADNYKNYEEMHAQFYKRFTLNAIIEAFKREPILSPVSTDTLPNFKVKLTNKWKGKRIYKWKEIVCNVADLPQNLILTKIEEESIVLTYVVLPCFYGKVVEVLTDVSVLKRFAANGVEIELSEHLLQYGQQEIETLESIIQYPSHSVKFQAISFQSSQMQKMIQEKKLKKLPQPAPVPPKGGYDNEIFVISPPVNLQCPICHLILREPHQLDCCGIAICETCMLHTNAKEKCPQCRSIKHVEFPDRRLEQEMMSLKVKCTNEDCEWKGELVDYNNHITDKCPNRVVQCQYDCGLYFMASEVSVHEEEECTKRPYEVVVQYYEKQAEATREFYEHQIILLEEKQEKLKKFAQAEERSHLTREFPSWYCPSTDLISSSIPPCIRAMTSFTQHRLRGDSWYSQPFYTGPGGYKLQLRVDPNTSTKPKGRSLFQKKREDTHISVCVHLMKGENDKFLGWPFEGSVIVKLLNWIEDKNHLEHFFSTTSTADPQSFSRVVSGIRARGEMYQRNFIAHKELEFNGEKKTHYVMEDVLCFVILSVEVLSNYQSSLVPEWTHPGLSLVSYGAVPVYRTVKEFNQLKANGQPINTDPFYTAKGGYKMIMIVCPNGYGSFKRTHLSVFIKLMRGENDHTLSYPINGIFKIQLLNWRQNRGHVEKIVQFDESILERYRLQVTTGEEAAEGYGLADYLSHDELENSSGYKEYIHNNTLCFKIQFEPTQQTSVPSWCDVMYTNSSTPPCTRTLTRYSEYKRTNSAWYSPPFYSRDKGYKLHLKVDANGNSSGKGTHLSLYVYLLKGEYDNQLQWPFNATITVQLLNWSEDNGHEKKSIPHHRAALEYRTRVTGRDRALSAWGYDQFISHSILESAAVSSDTRYINDDNVCFRIVNVEII